MATAPDSAIASTPAELPPQLLKAMGRISELSSLPEITTRIVRVVEDPRATAHDMHEIVKNDPALATKILKVVNSAFYGLPSKIASLDRAIIMLGLSAVKNIALAASLAQMFRGGPISERFARQDLWRHCIAVGVCSRMLATRVKLPQVDEYFVAGLVHDMGLLVIAQLWPEKLREIADLCLAQPQKYCEAERAVFEADHQQFGAALAARWKFPPALRHVTAYHHDPSGLQAESQQVATLVYVADTICSRMQHGYYLTAQAQEITAGILATINLDPSALGAICEDLPAQIEEAEQILVEA